MNTNATGTSGDTINVSGIALAATRDRLWLTEPTVSARWLCPSTPEETIHA
jgi:hypothetical protein